MQTIYGSCEPTALPNINQNSDYSHWIPLEHSVEALFLANVIFYALSQGH